VRSIGHGEARANRRRRRCVLFAGNLVPFLNRRMLLARRAAAFGLLVVLCAGAGGCGQGKCSCPSPPQGATIDLGCVPAEPPVVKTTGPCSVCPTALANGQIPEGSGCAVPPDANYIVLLANGAGTCHVQVTFGSGPTSSLDVDFASVWIGCGSDPHGCGEGFVAANANGGPINVSVPEPICDAGLDASAASCTLQSSAYDQSCRMDSDCQPVFLGNVCDDICRGVCATAGINVSAVAQYTSDLSAAQSAAGPTHAACSCAYGSAVCRAGVCAVGSPVGSADAGSSCKTDADCPTGSSCGFPISACAAAGACFKIPNPLPPCAPVFTSDCTCDGSTVSLGIQACLGFPNGFAQVQLLHEGACADAAVSD
jgi:hypothetical protein